jgi:predicted DNA-binding transcriptional regulator YafY
MRNAEVIRQWQILRTIEARRTGVTIHELAGLTGVTTRTIRRDLIALQEAGFSLYDEGHDTETKRWRLDQQPFRAVESGLSVADVAALYLSKSVVDGLAGWLLSDDLRSAFGKIERALNPRMREFLGTLPQVVGAKAGPQATVTRPAPDVARRLLDAARDRRVVQMRYFSAQSNRAKTYTVQPYRLMLALGGVYLAAWVPDYDAFRTFAVERIEKLTLTEDTFRRTRDLPGDLFGASMGVYSGDPERVVVEFDARSALYVGARTWHHSQQIERLADGRLRLSLRVAIDWALRSWLMGFGAAVRILEPTTLAAAIAEEHARAARQGRVEG